MVVKDCHTEFTFFKSIAPSTRWQWHHKPICPFSLTTNNNEHNEVNMQWCGHRHKCICLPNYRSTNSLLRERLLVKVVHLWILEESPSKDCSKIFIHSTCSLYFLEIMKSLRLAEIIETQVPSFEHVVVVHVWIF